MPWVPAFIPPDAAVILDGLQCRLGRTRYRQRKVELTPSGTQKSLRSHNRHVAYRDQAYFDDDSGSGVPIDGGWSDWSPWSDCQVTCGAGFKLSNRWCNKPEPQSGGKECEGEAIRKEPCSVKVHCPVNGGLGSWGQWSCSVSCGGGTATRIRKCDKPKPLYGGLCIGNSTERWLLPCNAFTCPSIRRLSNETIHLLAKVQKDFFVRTNMIKEGAPVAKVQCGSKELLDNLLWELKLEVRKAVTWLRNGQEWTPDKSRVEKTKFTLHFKKVAPSDTGFYSCELDLLGGGRKILKAFSLIVLSNKTTDVVDVGKPFELECNALTLGTLYPNARVSWYFNETLFRSFNDTPAVLTNALKFEHASVNHTGDWECMTYEIMVKPPQEEKGTLSKIKDKILGKKEEGDVKAPKILRPLTRLVSTPSPVPAVVPGKLWITNKVRLRVNPPKSIRDLARTPQFLGLCAGVAVLAGIVIVALVKGKANDIIDRAEEKARHYALAKEHGRKTLQVEAVEESPSEHPATEVTEEENRYPATQNDTEPLLY